MKISSVDWLDKDFQAAPKEQAVLAKVHLADGSSVFAIPKQTNAQKALLRRILPNPMHTATQMEQEWVKDCLAYTSEEALRRAPLEQVRLEDLISIQPTIDEEKVSEMVEAGSDALKKAPPALVLQQGGRQFLADGNHRAIAFQRLGEDSMSARVVQTDLVKAGFFEAWGSLRPMTELEIEAAAEVYLPSEDPAGMDPIVAAFLGAKRVN